MRAFAPFDEPIAGLCIPEAEPALCAFEIVPGGWIDPPEFCEEEALADSDFCPAHDPAAVQDYLDARAERRREEVPAWV